MPLVAARANAGAFGLGWSAAGAGEELGGMVLLKPTSIASTGSGNSSSIGTSGSVTFSSCATLSLNGVFSADYDNYVINMVYAAEVGNLNLYFRLRSGEEDNATASSYTSQYLVADGSGLGAGRSINDYALFGGAFTPGRNGLHASIYGPYLAQPTAYRETTALPYQGAYMADTSGTHNQSASYDGFTILVSGNSITGAVSIYGLVSA
jgi:hypothetical protein